MSSWTDIGGRDKNEAAKEIYTTMEKGLDQPAENATDIKPFHFIGSYRIHSGKSFLDIWRRMHDSVVRDVGFSG